MLVGEALAITLAAARPWGPSTLTYFAYASLFIQWIILANIGILCWGRDWFERYTPKTATTIVFFAFQVITLIISELGYQLVSRILPYFEGNFEFHMRLLLTHLMISCVISLIVLKVFQLQHQGMQRTSAAAAAKMEALQARIRPHFLFNSMNTIANLVHTSPDSAEDAILDLSELFRSSLGKHEFVSLNEEIRITQRYINIESLRLSDRLEVEWTLPEQLPNMELPALLLQPLVENAIYHGVEPLPNGGKIEVLIEKGDNQLVITISNPIPDFVPDNRRKGNQVAMTNIRQRLALIYGDDASMQINKTKEQHSVCLTFPLIG